MGIKFTNNAEGDLNAGITAIDTTVTLNAGQGDLFPIIGVASGDWFYGTLFNVAGNREVVKCTERQAGSNTLTIVRGEDGSTPFAFSLGDKLELRIPSIVFEEFDAAITQNTTDIGTNDTELADHETRISAVENGIHASGNVMWFYQNTAPTGWTIGAVVTDTLLAIKGGSQAFNVDGGNVAGSWSETQHTHTGPSHTHPTSATHSHTFTGVSHTHTTGDHQLTIAEMPAHTHGISASQSEGGSGDREAGAGTSAFSTSSGGDGVHNHGVTGSAASSGTTGTSTVGSTDAAGTGATGSSGAPSTDRPRAAVGILATKD